MNYLTNLLTAVIAPAPTEEAELFFQPENFVTNLQYMGVGMLVIFAIIGVIILTTLLVNKAFSD